MAIYTHNEVSNSPGIWWGNETRSGASLTVTSTLVIVQETDGTETRYTGTGLSLNAGVWTGTVTGASHTSAGGSVVYEGISGFSLAAGTYIGATNVSSALAQIFAGPDTLTGYSGNDTLISFEGNDQLSGGTGNNSYQGRGGADTFTGGTRGISALDFDTAVYSVATAGIVATLSGPQGSSSSTVTGDASVGTDTLINMDGIRGSNFADTFTVTDTYRGKFGAFNQIEGGGGDDTINGNGSTRISYINAAAGVTVSILAGTGQSTAAGDAAQVGVDHFTGVNAIRGSNFADNLSTAGARGNFQFEGEGGNDTFTGTSEGINNFDFNLARYDFGTTAAISVSLGASSTVTGDGSVGTDTLVSVEAVRGTSFNDSFTVLAGFSGEFGAYNNLQGMGGNDTFAGNGSTQIVYTQALAGVTVNLQTGSAQSTAAGDAAGVGIDTISGGVNAAEGSAFADHLIGSDGAQAERFRGDAGNDIIDGGGGVRNGADYRSTPSGVVVNLATGQASDGYGGTDTLIRIQDASGSEFNDVITGDGNINYLIGQGGNDVINGGGGNDVLVGDDTNLNLYAGAFGVSTEFDSGNDILVGGTGDDLLVGGPGDDRYVFAQGDGNDTIGGFVAGAGSVDKIVLEGVPNLHTLSDVLAITTQQGADAVINFGGGDSITLQNVQKTDLSADDFVLDFFSQPAVALAGAFNPANGWTSEDQFPRHLADVNGDGSADIVGFGNGGVYVSLANGDGSFAAAAITLAGTFNPGNGWTSDDAFHRELADVNGDHMADIIGFGNGGVYVSLATGGGNFAPFSINLAAFNPGNGWTSQDQFPRELADVNGDGMADIVGFGNGGVYVSLATGGGNFATPKIGLAGALNPGNGWTSQDQFPRELADVNGDGMADIVGFGNGGAYVALATGDGNFATPIIGLAALNPANGWTSQHQFLRELADVNHDGMADIVGFGNGGVYVAVATGGGHFAAPIVDIAAFNPGNGWTAQDATPRELADVNHDGSADIVGFGNPGVLVALANDFHLT